MQEATVPHGMDVWPSRRRGKCTGTEPCYSLLPGSSVHEIVRFFVVGGVFFLLVLLCLQSLALGKWLSPAPVSAGSILGCVEGAGAGAWLLHVPEGWQLWAGAGGAPGEAMRVLMGTPPLDMGAIQLQLVQAVGPAEEEGATTVAVSCLHCMQWACWGWSVMRGRLPSVARAAAATGEGVAGAGGL